MRVSQLHTVALCSENAVCHLHICFDNNTMVRPWLLCKFKMYTFSELFYAPRYWIGAYCLCPVRLFVCVPKFKICIFRNWQMHALISNLIYSRFRDSNQAETLKSDSQQFPPEIGAIISFLPFLVFMQLPFSFRDGVLQSRETVKFRKF